MAIKNLLRNTGSALRLGAAIAALMGMATFLASCGGGGVAAVTSSSASMSVLPSAPDLYENTPTVLTISGGKAPYKVFPANTTIIPTPSVDSNTFRVIANPVASDIGVKITVADSSSPQLTVDITANVKASQLNNTVTVTPTSVGQTCGAAICTGGTGTVTTVSSLNGIVQRGRSVKFDVVNGDFKFVTPGTNALVTSITTTTDQQGVALAVIQANVAAPSQTATLQVTDVTSGQFRRFNFGIQQITTTNNMLIIPATVTWTGAYNDACTVGGLSSHYIFGGTPPYTITTTDPVAVTFTTTDPPAGPLPANTAVETKEGGAVLVATTGLVCTTGNGIILIVRDKNGGIAQFTVANQRGSATRPTTTPPTTTLDPPTLNPADPGPVDCGQSVTSFVNQTVPAGYAGTAPAFTATPLEPTRFSASVTSSGGYNIFTLTRLPVGPGGPNASTLVRISNGQSFADVSVSIKATTGNACAVVTGNGNPLASGTSNSISLSLTSSPNKTVSQPFSGGVGPYTITSVGPSIATVGPDGVTFSSSTVLAANTVPFFVQGVVVGVTFITVTDSSTPSAQTLVYVVTVNP